MTDPTQRTGRACRHFIPQQGLTSGNCCGIGHPITKIVTAANGGSTFGIAYMMPCCPTEQRKADCPNYDPKTEAEIAEAKERMRAQMDRLVKALPALNDVRATMVSGRITRQVIDCPFCNHPRSLHVTCAIDHNNHMSARCAECGEGFIE
jgi:hypothetical protein